VQALVDHLNQTMTDPFDVEAHPTCLINIFTDMHATKKVYHSLLTAVDEGGKMCKQFANSAFSVDQSGSFYNPIPKSKLKTFEHMTSKTNLKCKSGEIISGHINPELAFRRALVLAMFYISSRQCTVQLPWHLLYMLSQIDQNPVKRGQKLHLIQTVSLDLTCRIFSLFHHHDKEKQE
jgi:hypothetical protein